jgi:hypothetical protein
MSEMAILRQLSLGPFLRQRGNCGHGSEDEETI